MLPVACRGSTVSGSREQINSACPTLDCDSHKRAVGPLPFRKAAAPRFDAQSMRRGRGQPSAEGFSPFRGSAIDCDSHAAAR